MTQPLYFRPAATPVETAKDFKRDMLTLLEQRASLLPKDRTRQDTAVARELGQLREIISALVIVGA